MTGNNAAGGRVYLVGAGPGDPGLLTLRAAAVLRQAEVLLFDALASEAIVQLAPESCERIFVGKRAGDHAMEQEEIERLAIAKAREGRVVVRLKGGDPFVFGRGGEEAQALRATGIPFEIVPGISSAFAVPAYAGIPVTHRDYAASVTILTGHEDPAKPSSTLDWERLADPHRTLILLMATANLRQIADRLREHGLASTTPVAIVQDGTRPNQRTVLGTLSSIAEEAVAAKIGSPAIVVVGGVAQLREQLRWFDTAPLFGRRVLITRTGPQAAVFAESLLARGAQPIVAPTIEIVPPGEVTSANAALDEIASFAWVIFTSQNGVDFFFAQLRARRADARALGGAKVAAIGERTANRLREYGVNADLVPDVFVSEEMAGAVIQHSEAGERVLIYRAQEARDALPRMLEAAGRNVTIVAGYKTVVPNDPQFAQKVAQADVLTFTSASTVNGFVTLLGGKAQAIDTARGKCVACIGPITASAASETGLHVDAVAQRFTTEGLLAALEEHLSAQSPCR
ncbi:MAG: uroporphyrinogen-III C-methyltransferase [Candidatus Eremiobacteraeota bacterium]|nr:uroporphyrinogen-III C-methyltransferase [Candidatus Eremiobacteraeota bacterium]